MAAGDSNHIDAQIDEWRTYLRRRQSLDATEMEELEGHLRDQVAELVAVGLHDDEALLIAFKRLGNLDALSREFARVSALTVDVLALMAIAGRITEFGMSPNRFAALGLNIILLINLTWSAWLYFRFLTGHAQFAQLERWQTSYLPVYGVWAATVVVVFPPAFAYV